MALQKRDPETGKFISRSDFDKKYPNGLTQEEYLLIRAASKRVKAEKAELDKAIDEHLESADHIADQNPEAVDYHSDNFIDQWYRQEAEMYEDFTPRGCLTAVSIMLIGIGFSLLAYFTICD